MNISWSKQAAESLKDTTTYVRKEFGVNWDTRREPKAQASKLK